VGAFQTQQNYLGTKTKKEIHCLNVYGFRTTRLAGESPKVERLRCESTLVLYKTEFNTKSPEVVKEHTRTFLRQLVLAEIIDDYRVAILFSDNASEYKSGKTIAYLKDEHAFGADKTIIKIFKVKFKVYLYLSNKNLGTKAWEIDN
jgi:hypothetical protein